MLMRRQAQYHTGLLAVCMAALLSACGGGGGGDSGVPVQGSDGSLSDPAVYSTQPGASLAAGAEAAAVTHHQITLGGTAIAYTATAGHMTASDPASGQAQASFFYVAYTADNQNLGTRPVTFFYNGGPGSASVWLHMGSFGPKRIATGEPSISVPQPFPLVDNTESLLDTTDLIFVDAVGTGYSEAIAPNTNQSFWGVDADAAVFRNFVQRYLQVYGRQASPKFLFGESYGTTRSAVLANLLETAGVALKGVVLQSSVLDYNSNCGVTGLATTSCAGYLPSYGAVGAYYMLTNPAQPDLASYMQQMRSFTLTSYAPAVSAYLAQPPVQPSASLINTLSLDTGASVALWQAHFNLDPGTYRAQLLPGSLIGGYDARVFAPYGSALASEGDPSSTLITASFAGSIADYLKNTLLYNNASTYVLLSNAIASWNFSHDGQVLPDTVPDLLGAMLQNPKLQLLSLNGYHDLVTPYFQTEQDLARLPAANQPQVQTRFYAGGHMTYLDDGSRPLEKSDLRSFYQAALAAQ
ncbi:MAG TPA: peptidase S10 [Methylibium sp.]